MKRRSLGNTAVMVLAALGRGTNYGFDIMDETGLKSGSVYRALCRLEELRLVHSRWEAARVAVREKRPRRRYYEITDSGKAELESARDRLAAVVGKLSTERQ